MTISPLFRVVQRVHQCRVLGPPRPPAPDPRPGHLRLFLREKLENEERAGAARVSRVDHIKGDAVCHNAGTIFFCVNLTKD